MSRLNLHPTLLADDLLDLDPIFTARGHRNLNLTASTALTICCPGTSADRLRRARQVIQQGVFIVATNVLGARPWQAEPSTLGNVAAATVLRVRTGARSLLELVVDIGMGGQTVVVLAS